MSTPPLNLNPMVVKMLATAQATPPAILSYVPPVMVRKAHSRDLHDLAHILTLGFHSPEGLTKWVLPILRMGIYEDLRHRLHLSPSTYACLVAAQTGDPPPGTESSPNSHGNHSTGLGPPTPSGISAQSAPGSERPGVAPDLVEWAAGAWATAEPIGTVEMAVKQRSLWQPQSRYVYLSNLAVRADWRRQGVASQLLQGCEHIAHQWGFEDIYLHVLENNRQAKGLYQKLGYQVAQVDADLLTWILQRPRQLLLHKHVQR